MAVPTSILTLINKSEINNILTNDPLVVSMTTNFATVLKLLAPINGQVTPVGPVRIPNFPVDAGVLNSYRANHCDVFLDPTSNTWTMQFFGFGVTPSASGNGINGQRQALGQATFIDDITLVANLQAYNWLRKAVWQYGVRPEYERLASINNFNSYMTIYTTAHP